jgi:AraC-like DNA-binding protein
MRRQRPPRTFTHAHRQRLERAAEHYLQDCYRKQTAARASEFAEYLGVTHPYLSRIAPEIAGKTLRDLLRTKQLAYAVRLLRTTPLVIREIAVRCGFGTVSTFYRCFEAAHGVPPGVFREVKK